MLVEPEIISIFLDKKIAVFDFLIFFRFFIYFCAVQFSKYVLTSESPSIPPVKENGREGKPEEALNNVTNSPVKKLAPKVICSRVPLY